MLATVRDLTATAASALRTNLGERDLDDEALELGDELIDVQTLRFKVMLSAKLLKMRATMDDVTPAEETSRLLLQDPSNWWIVCTLLCNT
jgi:hypothetical protein